MMNTQETDHFIGEYLDPTYSKFVNENPNLLIDQFTISMFVVDVEISFKVNARSNVEMSTNTFVLVFPAVEYDFAPNRLEVSPNSYIHIQ